MLTARQLAMIDAGQDVKINPGFRLVSLLQAATANVRSTILEVTPDVGGFVYIRNLIVPIVKAFDATPTEVPGDTEFYLGVQKAGSASVDYAPLGFDYYAFADLTSAAQADGINRDPRGTLAHNLGKALLAEDGDKIVVQTKCSLALDLSKNVANTRFQVAAIIGRML